MGYTLFQLGVVLVMTPHPHPKPITPHLCHVCHSPQAHCISSSIHHPLLSTRPNVMFKVKSWILVIILWNCLHQIKIFFTPTNDHFAIKFITILFIFNEAPSRLSDHRFLRICHGLSLHDDIQSRKIQPQLSSTLCKRRRSCGEDYSIL